MRKNVFLIAALGIALTACGNDDGDGKKTTPTPTPTVVTASNYFDELVAAFCKHILSCKTEYGTGSLSAADCQLYFGFQFMGATLDPSLYNVDSAKARSCFDAVAATPCGESPADNADCDDSVQGVLQQDACCDDRGGCGPGLKCEYGAGNSGTCQPDTPVVGADQDCSAADCDVGLYCDDSSGTPTCKQYKAANDSCTGDTECGVLVCRDNKCQKELMLNDTCNPADDQCGGFALQCVGSGATGTCQAPGERNATCDPDGVTAPDCAWYADVYCNSGTCADSPGLDGDCFASQGYCANIDTLYCSASSDYSSATCKSRITAGNACDDYAVDSNDGCAFDSECNTDTKKCELRTGPAAVCL